jgi:hypothetical protein
MTEIVPQVALALQTVFTQVADRAARESGFVQRESKITGNLFVQTLVFGWLRNPQAPLEELALTARHLGVPVSPQALDQRFGPRAAACLRQTLEAAVTHMITADPAALPLLQRFPGGVCLLDSTSVTLPDALADHWPGCGGTTADDGQAALKLFVRWNLTDGGLSGPFLHAGRTAEQTCDAQAGPLAPGTLRLADLGFFSLAKLQALSAQKVHWLTRWQPGTKLYDADGHADTLAELLARQTTDRVDVSVALGAEQRLPCRLLAVRVPPAVVAQRERRRQARRSKQGRRKAKKPRPDQLALLHWNVYVTNVPLDLLTLDEALVLARCRWQIELLFKLWKNEGRLDESRSGKPWRILCELYAKLLGMVVQHWLLLSGCWSQADRSLVKASRVVRQNVMSVANVLTQGHLVRRELQILAKRLTDACRIRRRPKDPPTHHLLRSLSEAA